MFQFNRVVKDEKNEALRRREVTVEFINELSHVKSKLISFTINEDGSVIKKAFGAYLDELNYVPPVIIDINLPPVVDVPPTQAELDRKEWDVDRLHLKTSMELVRDGVFTGTEKQITNLQAKVKAGFKVEYLS